MTSKRPAPLASLPADMLPKTIYLLVVRDDDYCSIERAYLSREAAERNLTLGQREDYIAYLERHAELVSGLLPDTDPTPQSFVDFASARTDREIEEVEVVG